MNHHILPNGDLAITVDGAERAALRILRDDAPGMYQTDDTLRDLFESLICNSELDWCAPADIGALTSAPILCARNEAGTITAAWGFMDYQLRSPQDDLLDTGRAVFRKGY